MAIMKMHIKRKEDIRTTQVVMSPVLLDWVRCLIDILALCVVLFAGT